MPPAAAAPAPAPAPAVPARDNLQSANIPSAAVSATAPPSAAGKNQPAGRAIASASNAAPAKTAGRSPFDVDEEEDEDEDLFSALRRVRADKPAPAAASSKLPNQPFANV